MTDLEQAVQVVENGLRPAIHIAGRPQQQSQLGERIARDTVPGFSVALIEGNEIAWARGYGVLETGGDEAVTSETLFQAASISKPVSAMAALRLVETGTLDPDANVNEALRSWQVPENEHTREHKVTLRGLLSHTAGLTVRGYRGYAASQEVPTVQQVLDGEPPANSDPVRVMQEPGTGFCYSGGGYTVMQQLIEDVTGKPFADLLQELVLDKLGMTHSTFEQPLSKAYAARAATAHWGGGEPVPGKWHTYPELATAGLWSTPSDLARFAVEVLKSHTGESNAVLSVEMTRQMLTPPASNSYSYGLGLDVIEAEGWTRFEHLGWNEGYHSFMCGYIGAGQGVAWMSNGENGKLLGQEVMRGLAGVYGWPGFEPVEKTVVQVDTGVYARYVGKYQFADDPNFGAEIVQEGDRLFWQDAPGGTRYELYPASDTVFFSLERQEEVTFARDASGSVEAMTLGEYWRLERAS